MPLTPASLKIFVKAHAWLLRIGLITAAVIIGFQLINQLVIYRYLKLDYYLSLVAVAFLVTGLLLKRPARPDTNQDRPLPAPEDTLQPSPAGTKPDLLALLTSKEYLVLRLLSEGKTNKEIAAVHFVEVSTIKTHINNIYTKLAVSNRAQARARYTEFTGKLPFS
jgi:DNA-binding CsgD family transcriptional regulator